MSAVLIITYAINPYYWPSFERFELKDVALEIKSLSKELSEDSITKDRLKLLYADVARQETDDQSLKGNLRNQYPILSDLSHPLEFPLVYIRWQKWLSWLEDINRDTWEGNRFIFIQKAVTIKYSKVPLVHIFLGIGISICGARIAKSFKNKQLAYSTMSFAYFLVNYLFIFATIDFNQDRYYLPTIIASEIIIAIGIFTILTVLMDYFRRMAVKLGLKPSLERSNQG